MTDVATNIRLPRKTLEALKIKAAKERKSLAQLVREAVLQSYGIGEAKKGTDPRKDPLYRLVGAFESGIKDGAEKHDRDIYGAGG